ncbi:hypothetical protein OIU77_001179, partial [Salix suchowensis]
MSVPVIQHEEGADKRMPEHTTKGRNDMQFNPNHNHPLNQTNQIAGPSHVPKPLRPMQNTNPKVKTATLPAEAHKSSHPAHLNNNPEPEIAEPTDCTDTTASSAKEKDTALIRAKGKGPLHAENNSNTILGIGISNEDTGESASSALAGPAEDNAEDLSSPAPKTARKKKGGKSRKSVVTGLGLTNWDYLSNGDGQIPSRILIGWNKATCNITQEVEGHPFLQLINKLRLVKEQLKNFHHLHSSHISRRVSKLREEWGMAQSALDNNPSDAVLMEQERRLAHQYNQLLNDEESYYRQKSRIQWLKQGDRNTKFFHRSLLHRRGRNTVAKLIDEEGMTITDPHQMGKHAANYYNQLLNSPHSNYQNSKMHFPAATSISSDLSICKADTVGVIKQALEEFSDHSGLKINLAKSAMYLTGITRAEKEDIERGGGIQL